MFALDCPSTTQVSSGILKGHELSADAYEGRGSEGRGSHERDSDERDDAPPRSTGFDAVGDAIDDPSRLRGASAPPLPTAAATRLQEEIQQNAASQRCRSLLGTAGAASAVRCVSSATPSAATPEVPVLDLGGLGATRTARAATSPPTATTSAATAASTSVLATPTGADLETAVPAPSKVASEARQRGSMRNPSDSGCTAASDLPKASPQGTARIMRVESV